MKSLLDRIKSELSEQVDNTFLVYFRVAFGAILFWGMIKYFRHDLIYSEFIAPKIHFGYYGFEWVKPWDGDGMYYHMLAIAISAACIALGFCYGLFTSLFFYTFTYFFLLDQSWYLNHFYLVCLLGFLMISLPANRAFSIDVIRNPEIRSDTCGAWVLWILRLQIAIPYFYGGLAKLNHDWLFRLEPMKTWMSQRTDFPIMGQYFTETWCVVLFAWSGLLIDLLCVPLMFWRRTRFPMLLVVSLFHIFNARLFNIGIFPWLMLAATWVLFLPPKFTGYLRFWGRRSNSPPEGETTTALTPEPLPKLSRILLVGFMAVQMVIPFRHYLYPGRVALTREGHCFSWRMKLNIRDFRYDLTIHYGDSEPFDGDGDIGPMRPETVWLSDWLTQDQARRMRNLDQVVKLARFIRKTRESETGRRVEVRGTGIVELNGNEPVTIFKDVDLSRQRITLRPARWLLTHPSQAQNQDAN